MKTIVIVFGALLMSVASFSQHSGILLDHYMDVKEALIKSDFKSANEHAISLQKAVETKDAFPGKEELLKAVQKMSKATDIEKQRTAFAEVSTILWNMVRNDSTIKEVIYYQYCPMKKMYWLSKEEAIRNPYYGTKMLSCGNVSGKKTN